METLNIDKPPELITNLEVMEILAERVKERDAENGGKKKKYNFNKALKQRDWIEEHVLQHLQSTSSSTVEDLDKMPDLVQQLSKYKLTTAEKLMVLNFMPSQSVELHLFLPELQSRMTNEKQEELLELVQSFTKQKTKDEPGDGDQAMEEAEDEEVVGTVDEE